MSMSVGTRYWNSPILSGDSKRRSRQGCYWAACVEALWWSEPSTKEICGAHH